MQDWGEGAGFTSAPCAGTLALSVERGSAVLCGQEARPGPLQGKGVQPGSPIEEKEDRDQPPLSRGRRPTRETDAAPAGWGRHLFPPCSDHQPENKPQKFQIWAKDASFPLSASVGVVVTVFPPESH